MSFLLCAAALLFSVMWNVGLSIALLALWRLFCLPHLIQLHFLYIILTLLVPAPPSECCDFRTVRPATLARFSLRPRAKAWLAKANIREDLGLALDNVMSTTCACYANSCKTHFDTPFFPRNGYKLHRSIFEAISSAKVFSCGFRCSSWKMTPLKTLCSTHQKWTDGPYYTIRLSKPSGIGSSYCLSSTLPLSRLMLPPFCLTKRKGELN